MDALFNLFAEEFSDEDALDILIRDSDSELRKLLALNPHLKAHQIKKLFEVTGQLDRTKATPERLTAVLLASRVDLTDEQIWAVLKSKNSMVRTALLTPQAPTKGHLTPEMLQYLLSQKWFDWELSLKLCYGSKFIMSDGVRADLQIRSHRRSDGRITTYNYRKVIELRQNLYYAAYLNPPKVAEAYHGQVQEFMEIPLPHLTKALKGNTPLDLVIQNLQEVIGRPGRSFYEIFFQMVATWPGSFNELVETSRSLSSAPAVNP